MNADQRRKFTLWFCILAPTGLALAHVVLVLAEVVPAAQGSILNNAAMVGWFALTFGCSVILALVICRRKSQSGGEVRGLSIIILTPIIAVGHGLCTMSILAVVWEIIFRYFVPL